jgi:hypothetical protein
LTSSYPNPELVRKTHNHCLVYLDISPSDTFHESHNSSIPMILRLFAIPYFLFKAALFGMYDIIVQTRNRKVTTVAA